DRARDAPAEVSNAPATWPTLLMSSAVLAEPPRVGIGWMVKRSPAWAARGVMTAASAQQSNVQTIRIRNLLLLRKWVCQYGRRGSECNVFLAPATGSGKMGKTMDVTPVARVFNPCLTKVTG